MLSIFALQGFAKINEIVNYVLQGEFEVVCT